VLDQMSEWICMVKAVEVWFQSAHHLTKGTGFAGDHDTYGRIYSQIHGEFDDVAERVLGLTNQESFLCPKEILGKTQEILDAYPSPANMSDYDIAMTALSIITGYCVWENNFHSMMDEAGLLTIGLDDLLSNNASNHEKYVYLLQQRTKKQ
jgi:DNA-binding ferritin-like protein